MSVLFTNNAATTLSAGINSSVTAIDVADGSVFPALSGSNYFYVTFENVANTQREIVKVTARSGNTLTVTRGQDGTTGAAFISSDKVELRLNAAALNEATAGQTAAEIRSLIESATDSNVFTDADHTKLDNVETYVGNQITALVDSSPATLDTLNELAAALGDDPSFATTVSTSIGTKWTQNNTKISNWDTAYGWGDHSTEGYVTTDTTYTAGSGLSLTGTEFANTAPDQTVSLTGSGATSISGTYPSFTISSTDTNTTYSVGDGGLTQKNFTTALKTKLDGIATGATNVTNNNQLTNGAGYVTTDTNTTYSVGDGGLTQKNFTTTLKTKLDGIETGATADQTPSQILTAVLGVDGSGSGLDADLLDGVQGSGYVNTTGNQNIDGIKVFTGVNVTLDNPVNSWKYIRLQSSGSAKWDIATNENDTSGALQFRVGGGSANTAYVTTAGNYVSDTQGTLWGSSNDGSGSGLDADLLDGQHGSYYSSASNLNAGTVPLDRMNKVLPSSGNYVWNNSTTAGSYTLGLQCSFVSSSQGFPSYGAVLHVGARGGADAGGDYQIYCGHGSNYGGNHLRFRNADNDASPSDSWTGWKTLWDSGNDGSGSGLDADLLDGQHGSYYYPKSGGTISGNIIATRFRSANGTIAPLSSSYTFSNVFTSEDSGSRVAYFDGNGGNASVWWGNGSNAHAALDSSDGLLDVWVNPANGSWYNIADFSTSGLNVTTGNVIAAADMRAPIFYDSANTGYYVDPSANSYLLGATYGGLSIGEAPTNYDGWNRQLNLNGSGHARIHAKTTSGRRMGIYAHDTWHNGGGGYVGTYSNHNMTFIQNAGSAGYIDTAKNLQWEHSVRAPIFYDSDNTGYYSDLSGSTTSIQHAGNIVSSNHGRGVCGLYSSTVLQNVFSMGAAYQLPAGGDTAGNLYGMAWSHPNAGTKGGANHLNDHGLLIINNGGFRAAISSRAVFSSDVRGTLFYDYNDTGYYVDPSSSGGNALKTIGDWRQASDNWSGEVAGKMQYHSNSWYIQYGSDVVFRNSGAANTMTMNSTGDMTVSSSSRAPIFYDSNNTGYYVDPASGSSLNTVYVNGMLHANAGLSQDGHTLINGSDTWYRTSGESGIYFSSYAGGWHMTDTTWIRSYNNKRVYLSSELAVAGNITAYYSDERLKTRTGGIDNALEKVQSLSGFTYVENDLARELGYKNEKQQVGVSAQEVQAVVPEAVSLAAVDIETGEFSGEITSKSGENYLTVDYSRLVPLLIEAVKELKSEVDNLKTQLAQKEQ